MSEFQGALGMNFSFQVSCPHRPWKAWRPGALEWGTWDQTRERVTAGGAVLWVRAVGLGCTAGCGFHPVLRVSPSAAGLQEASGKCRVWWEEDWSPMGKKQWVLQWGCFVGRNINLALLNSNLFFFRYFSVRIFCFCFCLFSSQRDGTCISLGTAEAFSYPPCHPTWPWQSHVVSRGAVPVCRMWELVWEVPKGCFLWWLTDFFCGFSQNCSITVSW